MAQQLESDSRPRAIGYVRVSSKKQAEEGASLEDQRGAIILHAVATGMNLVDVYADRGISGGKDDAKRPGLADALKAIRNGEASTLIVTHTDRLSRDGDLAGYLKVELRKAGGTLLSLDGVKDDALTSAVKRFIAEVERIRGSQRMRFAYAAKKRKGEHVGPVPFGSRLGADGRLEDDPETAPTVQRILSLRRAGLSLRGVADRLNADGIAAPKGAKWNAMTVSNVEARAEK